jgi:hypothetical protein
MRGAQRVGWRAGDRKPAPGRQLHQGLGLIEAHGEWLLAVDMLAGLKRRARNREVTFRVREVDDDDHLRIGEQLFKARISAHTVVAAEAVELLRRPVIGAKETEPWMVGERGHVVVGNEAGADEGDAGQEGLLCRRLS